MFSSKNAVVSIDDVPVTWIFEYYLSLHEKLNGQDVKIKSVFNEKDRNPSMVIYFHRVHQTYMFNCFSSGKYGNAINLVQLLKGFNYIESISSIINDYKQFLKNTDYTKQTIAPREKWSVVDLKLRPWNKDDQMFWSPYNIGSSLLELYNVRPIESFAMSRGIETFENKNKRLYGYFTASGDLYKIYRPMIAERKFFSIFNHIQGWDQLTGHRRLFICSSLKDIMSMKSLKIEGDYIAPSSETAHIESILDWIKEEHEEKYIIFDNDAAGIKTMNHYKEMYDIPYIHLQLSKDISDSVRDHGAKKVKDLLRTYINI